MSRMRRQNQNRVARAESGLSGSDDPTPDRPRPYLIRLVFLVVAFAGSAYFTFAVASRKDAPNQTQLATTTEEIANESTIQRDLPKRPGAPDKSEMVWIAPNEFLMGSAETDALRNELPVHPVKLDGFWIDVHEVTNEQYLEFVNATGYRTTAEKTPDWEELKKSVPPGTPKPPDDVLVAGSLVFVAPPMPVPTDDVSQWWVWTPGADWKHPEGPSSSIAGREKHPVVQISWDDAVAYAKWAGKRLPTEAEWECASRGGLVSNRFMWGNDPPKDDSNLANIWQGRFPNRNDRIDGWERTSPVKTYPPNGFGLYDMSGNVWEWCSDWYRADEYARQVDRSDLVNPQGPTESWDPTEPHAQKRVIRGGSFLCHITYCESYRTAARRGTTPDTGMSHLGFRCVVSGTKGEHEKLR